MAGSLEDVVVEDSLEALVDLDPVAFADCLAALASHPDVVGFAGFVDSVDCPDFPGYLGIPDCLDCPGFPDCPLACFFDSSGPVADLVSSYLLFQVIAG